MEGVVIFIYFYMFVFLYILVTFFIESYELDGDTLLPAMHAVVIKQAHQSEQKPGPKALNQCSTLGCGK